MSVKFLGVAAAAVLFTGSLASKAEASIFDIDYTANNVTINLVANATVDGSNFDINSLTGSVVSGSNTYTVNGMVGTGGSFQASGDGLFNFDNVITNVGGTWQLTGNGLLFTAGGSNYEYNLFSVDFGINNGMLTTDPNPAFGTNPSTEALLGSGTITAAVPEASTWAMMILGFLGLGVLGYRRQTRDARFA
jgi:hypothetical protein